jgi:NOL1/NOP2/sun family putative RNA methylase
MDNQENKLQINNQTKKPFKFQPKPEFENRINELLEDKKDQENYWEIVHKEPLNYIRCNTIKISPEKLMKIFQEKKWNVKQPLKNNPEIMIIQNPLMPGELGKSKEHLLGYYYVQEISSMLPIIGLKLDETDSFVDVCASPGSKTTQAAAMMNNKGNIIANDNNLGRMVVLAANLEKCGASNTIVTRNDGVMLCKKLKSINFNVDKILVDAPCSGEGTIRSSPKTFIIWNEKMIKVFSNQQKALAASALELLKEEGEMIYSTCTHAPEENEEVVQYLIDNFDIEILPINLPIKAREGLTKWRDKKFSKELKKAARIYPQDNNSEGFFLCKIKKISNNTKQKKDEEKIDNDKNFEEDIDNQI